MAKSTEQLEKEYEQMKTKFWQSKATQRQLEQAKKTYWDAVNSI